MRILVACEESQAVCKEFRKLGHLAYSCDIIECSGGHPEWHIKDDVLNVLYGHTFFKTMDDKIHYVCDWDMLLAFPPCTNLCVSGMRWFKEGVKDKKLIDEGAEFFMKMINAPIDKICVENPVGVMSTRYRKPDCIINPYQFGHPETKKTCLWLKNLPVLKETNNVYDYMMTLDVKKRNRIHWLGSNHSKERSKTYQGIARAMAEQWG